MTTLNPRSIKSGVLAAAVTVTTIVGALYGAELKSQHEKQQAKEKTQQTTLDEKIESLRSARETLLSKKLAVEKQIADLEARMAENEKRRKSVEAINAAEKRRGASVWHCDGITDTRRLGRGRRRASSKDHQYPRPDMREGLLLPFPIARPLLAIRAE
ncbi:hypothetical protein VTN49DRAFT_3586 [Thermomyces lanuginosus]|uniref:uncharacterized protein n=1 Tax=Thermomyces lanuginosus TaxID=5541 RepID=UPI003742D571